jgi:hypothetical protein
MFRVLAIVAAFAVGGGLVCLADDPPPAKLAVQPEKVPPAQPAQPGAAQPGLGVQPNPFRPATLARYEEEADVLDAQLDVKKAYVRAAEVGVLGAKVKFERISRLAAAKTVPAEELDLAKVDLEAATAQLDIRKAETKEVEVKVKYAKRRLEDAKNAPVRTTPVRPAVNPKSVDSKP